MKAKTKRDKKELLLRIRGLQCEIGDFINMSDYSLTLSVLGQSLVSELLRSCVGREP